jgi:alpha-ketoglutarate-dependent taurine dioxygenase
MLWETSVTAGSAVDSFAALRSAWEEERFKVFVLRGDASLGDNPSRFYEANFPHIGTPQAFAEDVAVGDRDNQRTGEIWSDVRYDPNHPDAYRHSPNAQPLHTDGSYIPAYPNATLMACFSSAGEGGETTFIDGDDVIACMNQETPTLLAALQNRIMPHARSGDRNDAKVIDIRDGRSFVNWNYYCVDTAIDPEGRALAQELFDYLANSPAIKGKTIGVKLMPNDAVTWKDRRVQHGRNAFSGHQNSVRHLSKCAIDVARFAA